GQPAHAGQTRQRARDRGAGGRRGERPGGRAQIHQYRLAALDQGEELSDGQDVAGDDAPAAISRRIVTIKNERGLHARAAAKFVKLAEGFDADVRVSRSGQTVSGRSIMGLMMLAAGPGNEVALE